MPIRIPSDLPAQDILQRENIFAMDDKRAAEQDIRPLEVGILNLMPNKIETEVQLLRLLSNTPLQINVDLIRIDSQVSRNTPEQHMQSFYHQFDDVAHKRYDGLIVTGAPLAHLDYQDVKYWDRMTRVMDWAKRHVQSTLFLCWAAHAAMFHYFGLQRTLRQDKLCGVYSHDVLQPTNELVRGFDPVFFAPHSRFGEIDSADYEAIDGLHVLAKSPQAGAYAIASDDKRMVFVTGHPEYDEDTLQQEFLRDQEAGLEPRIPDNYFLNDDPSNVLMIQWRSHGNLLFTNWLNYFVYQTTPYNLDDLRA
ncbi:homoserine O-acetyltransferase MetA [Alteromonas oceanisediminis]|uniref:homoserine O-acetyltransferase MetA n=1 Tax=Alteromonas oceanisediminis TaxID=2836180 RepID=UPI001BD98FED|nr:homoserine O-succinyltransferase [Alteromonas oceanisediminis]MBT0584893.1 homoserine O-succinyltransferase [Alteromonas oceanisediminis]